MARAKLKLHSDIEIDGVEKSIQLYAINEVEVVFIEITDGEKTLDISLDRETCILFSKLLKREIAKIN